MTDHPPDHLLPDEDDIQAVAEGRDPKPFSGTFEHPVHGDLTFTMRMPRAIELADHSVEMDNLLGRLNAPPRGGTMLLVAALAGLKTLVQLPVIDRKVEQVEESDGVEERVTLIYYEPYRDHNEVFPVKVWDAASTWRNALLDPKFMEALGKDSEPTPGEGSSTESDAPTASPSTTPA